MLLAYRASLHKTSLSPAIMTKAREPDLSETTLGGPEHASKQSNEPTEYVSNLSEHMEKVHNLACDNLAKAD